MAGHLAARTVPSGQPQTAGQLATILPALQAVLAEQRRFRREQLAVLATDLAGDAEGRQGAIGGEVTRKLATAAWQVLQETEAALARIRDGRYGQCLECGRDISLERLHVMPHTPLCSACHRVTEERTDRAR